MDEPEINYEELITKPEKNEAFEFIQITISNRDWYTPPMEFGRDLIICEEFAYMDRRVFDEVISNFEHDEIDAFMNSLEVP